MQNGENVKSREPGQAQSTGDARTARVGYRMWQQPKFVDNSQCRLTMSIKGTALTTPTEINSVGNLSGVSKPGLYPGNVVEENHHA